MSVDPPGFRPLSPDDAANVAALHAAAAEDPWSKSSWRALLRDPAVFGYAVDVGGRLAGAVLARIAADEGEILMIVVAREVRRRGVARALMLRVLAAAAARGAAVIHLEVADDNAAAIALYRDLGFIDAGRRIGYYASARGPIDARIMSLPLPLDAQGVPF